MVDTEYKQVFNGIEYIQKHGNPFDRGTADNYYGRQPNPHKGGVGGDSGPRITELTPEEIVEYNAGYEWNEYNGDKKDYGSF